jgi:hypothetical protein
MGNDRAIKEGKHINRPKTGYDLIDGELLPNGDAIRVQEIFRLRAQGLSYAAIEERTGIRYSTVMSILQSRVYLGRDPAQWLVVPRTPRGNRHRGGVARGQPWLRSGPSPLGRSPFGQGPLWALRSPHGRRAERSGIRVLQVPTPRDRLRAPLSVRPGTRTRSTARLRAPEPRRAPASGSAAPPGCSDDDDGTVGATSEGPGPLRRGQDQRGRLPRGRTADLRVNRCRSLAGFRGAQGEPDQDGSGAALRAGPRDDPRSSTSRASGPRRRTRNVGS